ncbi:MAG: hypothetical protein HYX34_01260 [Actinobacteria bacterium]|nr:hypothetical protein [Actinomycetota bacterium]
MADERPPQRLTGDDDHGRGGGLRGKLEEVAGWASGDRELEARGRVRRLGDARDDAEGEAGSGPEGDAPDDEVAETVAQAELDLRAERGELHPEAAKRSDE